MLCGAYVPDRRLPSRRVIGPRAALALVWLLLGGCATAAPAPWPPAAGEPRYSILVSVDTWHAMIAFPLPASAGRRQFEEWGYAEQAWYLEGRQGVSGALRALLLPTAGVVEVAVTDRIWAERTPQPPAEVFTFELTQDGYERLRQHLRATVSSPEPIARLGESVFYRARRSYHLFHQCHQYAALGLRAAGLPLAPAWALTRGLFAAQLRTAAEAAQGAGAEAEPLRAPPRSGRVLEIGP